MQSISIVSISNSGNAQTNGFNNVFLPQRTSNSRNGRKINHQPRLRSKSAALSGELRPINSLELRKKFPNNPKRNETINRNEKYILANERLKNEIKSAVLLIENRSQDDLLKMSREYTYENHSSNYMLNYAKSNTESQIERVNHRWKSASTQSTSMFPRPIAHDKEIGKYIKLLSLKHCEIQNLETNVNKDSGLDIADHKFPHENGYALATSPSNFLTNVLTIDELYGAANEWARNNSTEIPKSEGNIDGF